VVVTIAGSDPIKGINGPDQRAPPLLLLLRPRTAGRGYAPTTTTTTTPTTTTAATQIHSTWVYRSRRSGEQIRQHDPARCSSSTWDGSESAHVPLQPPREPAFLAECNMYVNRRKVLRYMYDHGA